jgi:hypothetical protein
VTWRCAQADVPSDRALLRQLVKDSNFYLMPAHFCNLVAYDKPCALLRDAKSQVPARTCSRDARRLRCMAWHTGSVGAHVCAGCIWRAALSAVQGLGELVERWARGGREDPGLVGRPSAQLGAPADHAAAPLPAGTTSWPQAVSQRRCRLPLAREDYRQPDPCEASSILSWRSVNCMGLMQYSYITLNNVPDCRMPGGSIRQ